ncbi:38.7 kDa protein [Lymantria xylina nucleopolyhedrovirus]|uniref:38.7 kDa protein n=1 Tax=Lymantria xylina multiple nucleopolyhedrovirus TaxID=2847840 RepID=D4N2H2_9ABAC|nr:38.7 kDa protein [Lymantria xylina nucleopolyhedrovirus]ADD73844.1 38.7 kDa protein [Lymantria xylina nucleopolyhedrovirus]
MARAILARFWNFIKTQWIDGEEYEEEEEENEEKEDEQQNAILAHMRTTNASIREIQQKLQVLEKIGEILKCAGARVDDSSPLNKVLGVLNRAGDDLSFLDEADVDFDTPPVAATVKLPKDSTKHPWLAVFAKEVCREEAGAATQIAFATSRAAASARKRKYCDMNLIYQGVHPNPQLAVCCITEEWQERGLSFSKRARQPVYVVDSNIQNVKTSIYENI